MTALKTPMDVLKLLDKSNCRQCNEPTCLAFAAQVFKGKKKLSECPKLDPAVVEQYSKDDEAGGETEKTRTSEEEIEAHVEDLKSRVRQMDLSGVAEKLGGVYENNRLTVKV
ncbi:MAG: (Fe-S)-binding protein, partial [Desulfosalsimonas sp.]